MSEKKKEPAEIVFELKKEYEVKPRLNSSRMEE